MSLSIRITNSIKVHVAQIYASFRKSLAKCKAALCFQSYKNNMLKKSVGSFDPVVYLIWLGQLRRLHGSTDHSPVVSMAPVEPFEPVGSFDSNGQFDAVGSIDPGHLNWLANLIWLCY